MIDKKLLEELGIVDWGYTEESKPQSFDRYEQWVQKGLSAPLTYLSDHRKDLRQDLKIIYPDFQSALVFLFSYREAKKWMIENNRHEVAAYAFGFEGEDYHHHLKKKLETIALELKAKIPELEYFFSLDAQPVLERDLAMRAGLGWFGKNSMLINQKEGSYFIIGSLLLNRKLPLEIKPIDVDHCGQCLACIDACPTNAIDPESRTILASQCISTFTIETMKEASPPEGFQNSRGEIFGCDICQDVCPWNRKPLSRTMGVLSFKEQFRFLKELFYGSKDELAKTISQETNRGWRKKLFGTALDRPGKIGWLKNLK